MKVLLINGSPHKDGSTYTVLKEMSKTFGEEGIETDIYQVGANPLAGCRGCGACSKTGKCAIDDNVNEFLDYAENFDGFVVGSPVHYASSSGAVASFLDRAFFANQRSGRRIFEHKPGTAVVVARRSGTTAALDQLNKYFSITEMPVISGRYWNMVHGSGKNDVAKDEEGMQNVRFVARNMAWHLKCQEAGRKAGFEAPKQETPVFTNFIR